MDRFKDNILAELDAIGIIHSEFISNLIGIMHDEPMGDNVLITSLIWMYGYFAVSSISLLIAL